jgi:hypothetical protein
VVSLGHTAPDAVSSLASVHFVMPHLMRYCGSSPQ